MYVQRPLGPRYTQSTCYKDMRCVLVSP